MKLFLLIMFNIMSIAITTAFYGNQARIPWLIGVLTSVIAISFIKKYKI